MGISYDEVLKSNYVKDLIKSIPNLNFDDMFWLSKVNEIIPKELIHEVKTYGDFEVYNHTILNWSDNLSLNRIIMGSCVFSYSSVLRNKKLFDEISFYYTQPYNIIRNKLLGYSLIGFQNLNELSDFLNVFYGLNFTIQELLDFKITHSAFANALTSVLLASMFASHTLIAYPILGKYGITKNRSVNLVVGGTMITDTNTGGGAGTGRGNLKSGVPLS